jgi:hypothetical protein
MRAAACQGPDAWRAAALHGRTQMKKWQAVTIVLTAIAALAAGAGAALAQDVNVNYVPGTDFTKYKTYKWVEIQGAEKPDQILDTQIKQAIDKAMAAKGLTKAAGDTADLAIGYQVALTQQQQWNAYSTGGYGARRYGGGMGTATSTTINIGTVALDMYDAAAKELVWKGQASKTVSNEKDPEKRQKNLDKAMAKLLKDFPPKTKK